MRKYLTAAIPMYAMAIALGLSVGEASRALHAQTDDAVVVIVNGRSITQKEVDSSVVSKVLPLEEQNICFAQNRFRESCPQRLAR
jgi:hypothetical protein